MSSRIRTLTLALALTGCAVEHGNPPAQQSGGRAPESGMLLRGGTPGPMHQVFARLRDTVAPGVERMSLNVMLAPETDRSAQRATMQAVLDAQRRDDSSLAAIRVLGFFRPAAGRSAHPSGMAMIPSAILEWVPREGWNGVSAGNARGPHSTDVLFVSDLPNHQRAPGAGTAR
jgi:hypothetical protein